MRKLFKVALLTNNLSPITEYIFHTYLFTGFVSHILVPVADRLSKPGAVSLHEKSGQNRLPAQRRRRFIWTACRTRAGWMGWVRNAD